MAKTNIDLFYPERIGWIGAVVLGCGFLFVLPFALTLYGGGLSVPALRGENRKEPAVVPFTFSLGLNDKGPVLPIPKLQGEMMFSFDPPRPIDAVDAKYLLVRLKKGAESKRVLLPSRVDLEFQGDRLNFAKGPSSFWVELSLRPSGEIEGNGFITSLEGEKMNVGSFVAQGEECPIRRAEEFLEGTPFRLLAEARWWGRDQFMDHRKCGERLEIGATELLELKEDDWLVWKNQKWERVWAPEKGSPIAHIQSLSGKDLVLEGWDSEGHVRISLSAALGAPFKIRPEELFTSIRVRSEKQISCMVEKQCMVLKTGDWVLKTGGRWKVLRKKEERDAVLNGKLFGELFVFDLICQKQGQKTIQGRLFNPGRTQMVPIELAAQSARQTKGKLIEKGMRKGKTQ